jgi:hypothetical protein
MSSDKMDFYCDRCGFSTADRKDWKRHISSKKHRGFTQCEPHVVHTCSSCGKEYKHSSGLSRHKKTCREESSVVVAQAQHIKELHGMLNELVETNRRTIEAAAGGGGNVYNTTNKMTVNVFLNEKCKEAMDLEAFVDSMVISASDLDYTRENGYVKGISNIFVKHLGFLGPTQRPIHCVDGKRLQFYVKAEGEWNRDGEDRVNDSIHQVSHKQIQQIKEWERSHPNWEKHESGVEQYLATIRNVMGGMSDQENKQSVDDIKRHLGANVPLRSALDVWSDEKI